MITHQQYKVVIDILNKNIGNVEIEFENRYSRDRNDIEKISFTTDKCYVAISYQYKRKTHIFMGHTKESAQCYELTFNTWFSVSKFRRDKLINKVWKAYSTIEERKESEKLNKQLLESFPELLEESLLGDK